MRSNNKDFLFTDHAVTIHYQQELNICLNFTVLLEGNKNKYDMETDTWRKKFNTHGSQHT